MKQLKAVDRQFVAAPFTEETKWAAVHFDDLLPGYKLNASGRAARQRLEIAIHEAIDRFHQETPRLDMLGSIELYPCPENCVACAEDATEAA